MIRYLIGFLILLADQLPQPADSLLMETYLPSQILLHRPPSPFFRGRPYFLDLFVDVPGDSLMSVSIFFKTENSVKYWETAMIKWRGRYRFEYDPDRFPGDTLRYFFVVTEKNFSIHSTPLDNNGKIKPVTIYRVDPGEYRKRRAR